MRLKNHSGPGARQEDKQLAVLWCVCHLLCLFHIYHQAEGPAFLGMICGQSEPLWLVCPQFPMPCPPLLANVSFKEGPRTEILQSSAWLLQGLSKNKLDVSVPGNLTVFSVSNITCKQLALDNFQSCLLCHYRVLPNCLLHLPAGVSLRSRWIIASYYRHSFSFMCFQQPLSLHWPPLFCCALCFQLPGAQEDPLLHSHPMPNTSDRVHTGAATYPLS